ncbi:MAG: hypothetical protein ACRELA_14470 [Candidatus Rokuibacteriota bacterium]
MSECPGDAITSSGATPYLAVVGRGHTSRFRFLQNHLEGPGFVEVIWDRRVQERRNVREAGVLDRRCGDRRQPLHATWTALSFVLTPRRGRAS